MSVNQISALDHTSAPAVSRFLARSPCPFVDRARVFLCDRWAQPVASEASLNGLAAELGDFLERADHDLAVLEIAGAARIASPRQAGSLLHALLAGLRDRDPLSDTELVEGIEEPAWDFVFQGHAFFVSVFAPFYPDAHPRWSGEPDTAFILLQPERGFRRFGVSAHRPRRRLLSALVEKRFERSGLPYDAAANQATPKARRYVKPIAEGDPPVDWWTLPYERA